MPGHFDKAIRVPANEPALAQAAAHQLCQAVLPLVYAHFPRGSAYQAHIDGQANGDLAVEVRRGSFRGWLTASGGNDMVYERGSLVRQYRLSVTVACENVEVEAAHRFSNAAEYYSRSLAIVVLGTALAVASNGLFFLSVGFFSLPVCAGFTIVSYGLAAGLGTVFGETLGGLFIQHKQRVRATDDTFADAEAAWAAFVNALVPLVEQQATEIEAGRIGLPP